LAISLGAIPGDPSPPDTAQETTSSSSVLAILGFIILGLPSIVGLVAILNESFPRRTWSLALTGAAMIAAAIFALVWAAQAWSV
jgi:hypothetical protein